MKRKKGKAYREIWQETNKMEGKISRREYTLEEKITTKTEDSKKRTVKIKIKIKET